MLFNGNHLNFYRRHDDSVVKFVENSECRIKICMKCLSTVLKGEFFFFRDMDYRQKIITKIITNLCLYCRLNFDLIIKLKLTIHEIFF